MNLNFTHFKIQQCSFFLILNLKLLINYWKLNYIQKFFLHNKYQEDVLGRKMFLPPPVSCQFILPPSCQNNPHRILSKFHALAKYLNIACHSHFSISFKINSWSRSITRLSFHLYISTIYKSACSYTWHSIMCCNDKCMHKDYRQKEPQRSLIQFPHFKAIQSLNPTDIQ